MFRPRENTGIGALAQRVKKGERRGGSGIFPEPLTMKLRVTRDVQNGSRDFRYGSTPILRCAIN